MHTPVADILVISIPEAERNPEGVLEGDKLSKGDPLPAPANVALLTALWSLSDGIWGVSMGR